MKSELLEKLENQSGPCKCLELASVYKLREKMKIAMVYAKQLGDTYEQDVKDKNNSRTKTYENLLGVLKKRKEAFGSKLAKFVREGEINLVCHEGEGFEGILTANCKYCNQQIEIVNF